MYLCASDLVVLPFKIVPSEPSLGVLEALSLGKPVITTYAGGLPELVDFDRGKLIRQANIEDLSIALLDLMRSPVLLAKLGAQAKKFTSELGDFKDLTNWTLHQISQTIVI